VWVWASRKLYDVDELLLLLLRWEERAARKNADARVRRVECTKKDTGSVSGEGDAGPPTRRRTGGPQNGEMSLSEGKR